MRIHLRTLIKGVLWEVLGIITAFLIFREWRQIGIYFFIRILTYYPYHQLIKRWRFHPELEIKLK